MRLLLCLLLACSREAPRAAPELGAYLYDLSGAPDTERTAAVAGWTLSRAEWDRVVIPHYRPLYDDYLRELSVARPVLVAQLAAKHPIATRAHFAGDPTMTRSQAITRWALPTLAPARLADLAGRPPAPLEAVFVDVGGRWRVLVGIGAIVRRRVAALDDACARTLDHLEPGGGRCIEAAWAAADAALHADRARFAHACGLAANLCGKRSP